MVERQPSELAWQCLRIGHRGQGPSGRRGRRVPRLTRHGDGRNGRSSGEGGWSAQCPGGGSEPRFPWALGRCLRRGGWCCPWGGCSEGSSAGLRVGAGRSSPFPGHCPALCSPVLRPTVGTERSSQRGSAWALKADGLCATLTSPAASPQFPPHEMGMVIEVHPRRLFVRTEWFSA